MHRIKIQLVVSVLIFSFAVAVFALPFQFLTRFSEMPLPPEVATLSLFGFGAMLVAVAIAFALEGRKGFAPYILFIGVSLAAYIFQVQSMSEWWIDDAGITFSYSRSFAEGWGITFYPERPPEEGYSSTLWMVILALFGFFEFDIAEVAKLVGVLCGAAALVLALMVVRHLTGEFLPAAVALCTIAVAPFSIWAASGQEHALQSLLLTLAAVTLAFGRSYVWGTFFLTVLIFVRPETPIIVATCFFTAVGLSVSSGRGLELERNLPIAVLPFLAFLGLSGFRIVYFGDLFPNPFYAKVAGSSPETLLNPFGAGWSYVLAFLTSSATAVVLPFLLFKRNAENQAKRILLFSVVLGHILFVVWAGGDWMGQFRFVMPILPILGILIALGYSSIKEASLRNSVALLLTGILATNTVLELNAFKAAPTTPLSVVSEIGQNFERLSSRIGIVEPLLAHHDAGAIAYERSVQLVDLGGLVDRRIAKNMTDSEYLEDYVLLDRKPDFIFGAHNFAARSGFLRSNTFRDRYVALTFADEPIMRSTYSHIRRDRIAPVPGLEFRRDQDGMIVEVIVWPL